MEINEDLEIDVPPVLRFNVGGTMYITTYTTICSRGKNFLSSLVQGHFSGKMKSLMVDDAFFIDRNGAAFEYVLQLLRGGGIHYAGSVTKKMLMEEMSFYQVTLDESEADQLKENTEAVTLFDVTKTSSKQYREAIRFVKESSKVIIPALMERAKQGYSSKNLTVVKSPVAGRGISYTIAELEFEFLSITDFNESLLIEAGGNAWSWIRWEYEQNYGLRSFW